jgi:hypothetical protein
MTLLWINEAQADLLQQYMGNDTTPTRGQISYGFGVSMPAGPSGGGNVIDLSAGIQKGGSCGNFNLAGELKGIFNKEALDQYVSGLTGSIVSGAPLLLLCYASQTLCDLYKHYRNMANAALSMRHAQCAQIEALAEKTGTSLRNNSIMQCISDRMGDLGYEGAVAECGQISDPTVRIPGSTTTGTEYSLTDAIAKAGSSDPDLQNFIRGVVGDVRFSAGSGIYTAGKTQYGLETQVSNLTTAYYNAVKDVGEQAALNRTIPNNETLKTLSTPGFPITPLILTRLSAFDGATRDNFYRQYASVAAMTTLLYKIEDAIDAFERAKAAAQDKDTIAKLEDTMKDMERRYALMERRLALQKDYLIPMMSAVMAYQAPSHNTQPTQYERRFELPKSILP